MTRCQFVVTACEGRVETTAKTMLDLVLVGGAGMVTGPLYMHWTSTKPPPFEHPRFELVWFVEGRGNSRASFFRSIRRAWEADPESDLVIIEDDVSPAKNALPYVELFEARAMTTFFNTRGWATGLHPIDDSGYWGTQMVKIPARLVGRLAQEDPNTPEWLRNPSNPKLSHPGLHGGDIIMGNMLRAWGEPVYQHRSIVQHVGAQSLCEPRATLKGIRVARDFVGESFDCLAR